MANVNAPKGFVPVRHLDGSPWNGMSEAFLIPSSDATAVFVGDIVKAAGSSGAAGTVVNGLDVEGMATVALATAGTTGQDIVGIVVGFAPDLTNLALKHRAASTNRVAYVVTDPTVVYEVQEDADTTPIAAASISLNVPYTTTAGSTVTGMSQMEIDSSAVATTATLPFKLIGLTKKVGNAFNTAGAGTDKAKFDVVLNTGIRMPNIAGV
jgi:hypothetical protein